MKRVISIIVALAFVMLMPVCVFAEVKDVQSAWEIGEDPIVGYLSLLKENKINIKVKFLYDNPGNKDIKHNYEVGDLFWIMYYAPEEASLDRITMQVPVTYRPKDEAYTLLLEYLLSLDEDDANDLYETLQYNVIDGSSSVEEDAYTVFYDELGDSFSLYVERRIKNTRPGFPERAQVQPTPLVRNCRYSISRAR